MTDQPHTTGPEPTTDALDATPEHADTGCPDTVPTADDDRPDMGGIFLGPPVVGETGCALTLSDTVRTTSQDSCPDSPDTGPSGLRFAYQARVPRHLAGAAFTEAFGLLHAEMDDRTAEPALDAKPIIQPSPETEDELRRCISDLTATLGEILARFTTSDVGGQMFRTIHVGPKTVEGWRQVLADDNRLEAQAGRMPKVQGTCPACRSDSLFLGSGGFVTCASLSCPKPDAPTVVLEQPPHAADECGRLDCITALATAFERARRATMAYNSLRVDAITAAKYIARQQRLGLLARDSRTQALTTLTHWVKDPGPLASHSER
ncbi:hypothetical protein [Streptomyces sp. NPDC056165]|uniref:hypothetical protein n=1 Tax=Streptomyces sp. NPDC056165 TaxID=3345733 RepID=UPI0035D8BE07